jgi:hypothetical protein
MVSMGAECFSNSFVPDKFRIWVVVAIEEMQFPAG